MLEKDQMMEWITDEMFNDKLTELVADMSADDLLAIPGIAEILRESLNNEIIRELENENYDLASVHTLDRDQIVNLLEGVSIHCSEEESIETLRDALLVNLQDGTIEL